VVVIQAWSELDLAAVNHRPRREACQTLIRQRRHPRQYDRIVRQTTEPTVDDPAHMRFLSAMPCVAGGGYLAAARDDTTARAPAAEGAVTVGAAVAAAGGLPTAARTTGSSASAALMAAAASGATGKNGVSKAASVDTNVLIACTVSGFAVIA